MTISAIELKLYSISTKSAEIPFPGISVAEDSKNGKKIRKKPCFYQVKEVQKPPIKLQFWHYVFFLALKSCYIPLEPPCEDC